MLTSTNIVVALPRLIFNNVKVVLILCVLKLRVCSAHFLYRCDIERKKGVTSSFKQITLILLLSSLVLRSIEQNETIAGPLLRHFNGYFALVNA